MSSPQSLSVSFTVRFSQEEKITGEEGETGTEESETGKLSSTGAQDGARRETRQYVNREGSFVTGFDVSTEGERQKRLDRAKRFGVAEKENPESGLEEQTKKNKLERYKQIIANLPKPVGSLRLEAVHVHGTDKMSSQDMLSYFRVYGPSHLEWINDSSCNVVWEDSNSAKRTLLSAGGEILCKVVGGDNELPEQQQAEKDAAGADEVDDQMNEDGHILSKEESMSEPIICPISPAVQEDSTDTPGEKDDACLSSKQADSSSDMQPEPADSKESTDFWWLGQPHPKAKFLFLRQARTGDKKVVGAAKQSRYYLLHGNPNKPGNPIGVSTKDLRKRKRKRKRQKDGGTVVEIMEVEEESNSETERDVVSETAFKHGSKRLSGLRMDADDVERGIDSVPMEVDSSCHSVPSDLPKDDLRHKLGKHTPSKDLSHKTATAADDLRHTLGTPADDLRHELGAPVDLRLKLQQRKQIPA